MVCMIDWVTARVSYQYRGPITGGRVMMISADGSIDWEKERWHEVEGSYSSKIQVRDIEDPGVIGCRLSISGNPSKFLQGHNLFGSDDVNLLVGRTMDRISDILGLEVTENDRWSWYYGAFLLSRVDVTRMYDVGSPERVKDWLASASQVAHSRYQSAGNDHGSTLYVGKHSRRVSLKIYDKLSEVQVRGHGLPLDMPGEWYRNLMSWASGKLRVEAVLRHMWLKDNNRAVGAAWRLPYAVEGYADKLLDTRLEGLEMSDTMKLTDEYTGELPGKLLAVYELWRAGRDLKALYSKSQFYNLRSKLLPYGIDIAHVRPREIVTENQYLMGAPLKSFLVPGGGAPVPEWAIGTELYVA
jgi:II/X family phage/plasmid replication protein